MSVSKIVIRPPFVHIKKKKKNAHTSHAVFFFITEFIKSCYSTSLAVVCGQYKLDRKHLYFISKFHPRLYTSKYIIYIKKSCERFDTILSSLTITPLRSGYTAVSGNTTFIIIIISDNIFNVASDWNYIHQ